MGLVKIELEDGKYIALHDEEHGGITVLRYNEPWRNETGDGFILAMIHRIQELEERNKILQDYVEENSVENIQKKMEPYLEEMAGFWYDE